MLAARILFVQSVVMVNVVESIKVLHSTSNASLVPSPAEIMNSDISELEDFTLCFRVISHQFSETWQIIVSFDSMLRPGGPYMIATVPAPDLYSSVGTDYLKDQIGSEYEHGKVYGYMSYGNGAQFFEIWTLGEWHSFCWVSSKSESYLKLYLDGKLVVDKKDFTINPAPKNLKVLLPMTTMNGELFSVTNTYITDLNIWDQIRNKTFLQQWSFCEEREEGSF